MQAAVDLADGVEDTPTPPELRLYWMCRRYGALPEPGAMLDQNAALIGRMTLLGNIYETIQYIRGLKGKEIANMRPDAGRLWAWLEEQGIRV